MRLEGKNIVVVGVGPGLGSATVYFLLKEGAKVTMVSRNKDKLEEIKKQLPKYTELEYVVGDPSTLKGAEKLAKDLTKKNKHIDGLALLAGNYVNTPIDKLKEEDLELLVSANMKAPLYMLEAALPSLGKGSSVVLVSSIMGLYNIAPTNVVYSMAKAAVANATEVLSMELIGKGIRVNAVAPNGMNHDFEPDRDWKKLRKLGDASCPPEDVARVITWLITDESEWVSGAVIPVTGGSRGGK
jgi:3-oxoacyl-[acyl-carrier protein] reductase